MKYVLSHFPGKVQGVALWLTGCSLANCELYLTLAHLLRRLDFELFETSEEDMAWDEVFVPLTRVHLKVM